MYACAAVTFSSCSVHPCDDGHSCSETRARANYNRKQEAWAPRASPSVQGTRTRDRISNGTIPDMEQSSFRICCSPSYPKHQSRRPFMGAGHRYKHTGMGCPSPRTHFAYTPIPSIQTHTKGNKRPTQQQNHKCPPHALIWPR